MILTSGRFLPHGHTVSISDLYFIAHHAGLLQSIVGIANRFSETGVVLSGERHVEANIVIKAVGFELNEGNERLVGRSRLHGGRIVDEGLWTIFESHPDGNFSNSAFGSCAPSGLEHRTLGLILHSIALISTDRLLWLHRLGRRAIHMPSSAATLLAGACVAP